MWKTKFPNIRQFFHKLGENIALHPWYFIICPIVVTCVLSIGYFNIRVEIDVEYLFTPNNGFSNTVEKVLMQKYFPTNDSGQFTASRKSTMGHFLR